LPHLDRVALNVLGFSPARINLEQISNFSPEAASFRKRDIYGRLDHFLQNATARFGRYSFEDRYRDEPNISTALRQTFAS